MGEKILLQPGSWRLPVGQWSLVLGRSGVGKTTLLNILSGFVRLPGVKRLGAINATTYLLDQRPVLIEELSVDDNILLFARSKADADAVMEALGFDHSLRLRMANSRLSGGEWQRVALGQAIAAHPEILYLDEPGTGIDRVRKYQLFSMIKENLSQTADGKCTTVICVDHEFLQIESFFSYIFEMLHGRLVCVQH
jgi:ABC-type multidrug transport system ATPase subunit